jgi:hypothetical protein
VAKHLPLLYIITSAKEQKMLSTKQRTQRKLDLSKAERNVVILDIPEKDRRCPACSSDELVPVGTGFSMRTGITLSPLLS